MLFEMQQIADDVIVLQRTVRYCGPLQTLINDGRQSLEDAYFELLEPRAHATGSELHGVAA